nr:PREDICTED: uncharacterized protein LOC109033109 [Bemisia tabaci]
MPLPQSSPSLKKILVEWGLSEDSARFISESGYVLEDLLLSEPEDLGPITDLLSHPETLRLKRGILKARKETAESQITEIYEVPAEVDSLLIDAVPVIDVSVPPSKKPRTDPPVTNDTTQQVESSSTNSSQFNPLIPPQNFLNHSNGLINPSVQIVQLKPKKVIISSHEVLLQALQEDNKGTTILHLYKINKKLGEVEQGILANFIINTELSQENKFIKAARFKELSLFIKRIFPSEDEVTWYSPYKPLKNGHGIPARGRLLNAYYTARKALIRWGVTPSQREKFKKTPVSGTLDTGKELTKEEKEELLKKIDFIQKHSKP